MMILIQYTQSTVLNALPVCPWFKVRSRFLAKYFVSANRRAGLIAWSPNNWSHLFSIVTICRTLSWKRSFYGKHVSEEVRITITIVIFCYVWIKDGMHAEYVMHSEYSVYTFSEMFLFKCGVKHLTQASHFTNSSLHFKSPYSHSSSFCMFIAQSISGRAGPQALAPLTTNLLFAWIAIIQMIESIFTWKVHRFCCWTMEIEKSPSFCLTMSGQFLDKVKH